MKKLLVPVLSCLILGLVAVGFRHWNASADVNVNCEPVPGTLVPTNFTGSAPSNVVPGENFTLSNITSSAESNLPVTITASDLKLSASNTFQTSYFKTNTSSYVDPGTGHKRAVFPDWQLTATGKVGDKIEIRVVEAVAHVQGVGPIVCPLSAVLATVQVVAPASNSTDNSKPNSKIDDTPDKAPTDSSNNTDTSATEPKQENAKVDTETQVNTKSYRIIVKDEKGDFVGGARVSIEGSETITSDHDGSAVIGGLTPGEQTVQVAYGNTTLERLIYVTNTDEDNSIYVTVPGSSGLPFGLFFAAVASVFTLSSAFVASKIF